MMLRLGRFVAIAAAWGALAGAAEAQPTLNAPTVVGANVTFTWSGGTAPYTLQAGIAPGAYVLNVPVGNGPTFQAAAPNIGIYFARIVDATGAGSNEVQIVVSSLVSPPAAPTGLQVYRNGTNVVIAWAPGAGGGPVSNFQLRAGLTPGGAEIGVLPTAVAGFAANGVGAGTYYLGVRAVNAGGVSAESAEVALVMPAGGACDAPPTPTLTTTAWGPYLTASWTSIPGAGAYLLSATGPGFSGAVPFGGNTNSFVYSPLPIGTWNFGIQAQFSCGSTSGSGASTLVVDGASLKLEPRVPDPAPGTALPGPSYGAQVVRDVAAAYPAQLRNSCGDNTFLFLVLRELRKRDKRWGLNWKRANVGDVSTDIIAYNWGPDGDEGTPKMRAWDMIGGHCGPNPGPNWDEKTSPTPPQFNGPTSIGGNGQPLSALWTLIPYIQAGFTP